MTWGYRPPKPGETVHKASRAVGVGVCGALERTGARFTTRAKGFTCPECIARIAAFQAAAKARFARETS